MCHSCPGCPNSWPSSERLGDGITNRGAIRIANQVNYGLAASIWTSDIRRGQRVARDLEAGSVWINCYLYQDDRMPFGGFKDSGVLREGGRHSIDFYTVKISLN